MGHYLADLPFDKISTTHAAFKEAEETVKAKNEQLLSIQGNKTVVEFHKSLGKIMWDYCGMARSEAGLKEASQKVQAIKEEFWKQVLVTGEGESLNMMLEKANRVADFIELGALMIEDALHRKESCGGHFREEYQTEAGEAKRDDENFAYVAAWEYEGAGKKETLHKEPLSLIHI